MSDYQCPSCGGFCKKSGCERLNAALTEGMKPKGYMVVTIQGTWKFEPNYPDYDGWSIGRHPLYTADQLAAAVLAERERCAKICENFAITDLGKAYGGQYASAIRGQK
jgi:hypothetical protein